MAVALPEEEALRADHYRLLARLFSAPCDQPLLEALAAMDGAAGAVGEAVAALAAAARKTDPAAAEREFSALFIGLVEGEVVPYGSYYLTGFLHDRPLARLRGDLARLGLARADGVAEPEDGIASLCEIMSALIDGSLGEATDIDYQRSFFEAHLAPWALRFFADLEAAASARLYRPVAALAGAFFEIEIEAFRLTN